MNGKSRIFFFDNTCDNSNPQSFKFREILYDKKTWRRINRKIHFKWKIACWELPPRFFAIELIHLLAASDKTWKIFSTSSLFVHHKLHVYRTKKSTSRKLIKKFPPATSWRWFFCSCFLQLRGRKKMKKKSYGNGTSQSQSTCADKEGNRAIIQQP